MHPPICSKCCNEGITQGLHACGKAYFTNGRAPSVFLKLRYIFAKYSRSSSLRMLSFGLKTEWNSNAPILPAIKVRATPTKEGVLKRGYRESTGTSERSASCSRAGDITRCRVCSSCGCPVNACCYC